MTADAAPNKPASQARRSPEEVFRAKWHEAAGNPQSTQVNPYPGLRSFNVDEAHIFRARFNQIRALRNAFAGAVRAGGARHVIMVVGGSSSGKSSIVKAGLLADIHSLQMPGDGSNWYVAECRPVQAPVQELLHGLATMVVDAIFNEFTAGDFDLATKVDEALDEMDAPEIFDPSGVSGDLRSNAMRRVRALLDARLWSARHEANPASMAPALTLFARESLNALDRHLHRYRAGPPRLLISIDQFEEIFRCPDVAGRDAIFGLIRFADQADSQNAPELYVVASMRSEELHRCSEFKGVADIVNRSVHLVELVLRDDAKLAIVEPGRFTLQGYGFPFEENPNSPFAKEAVEAIADAYEYSSGTIEHRADALSLLQHFLRLLWDRTVSKWIVDNGDTAALRVDLASLSAIRGWDVPSSSRIASVPVSSAKAGEAQHRLASVLNCRADDIYNAAIQAWCDVAKDSSERTLALARSVLKAAFVSLARRDDQRRVVRDWRTISEMLANSGEAERFAQSDATSPAQGGSLFGLRFEAPLEAALREFERATLIERRADAAAGGRAGSDKYTVYHEAFIRNWGQYADWVREVGKAADTLRSINEELAQVNRESSTPDGRKPEDIITAGNEADLSAVIGSTDEGVGALESRSAEDGQRGWASQAWAASEIARGAKSGETIDVTTALAEIRDARHSAVIARASHLELEAKALKASAQAAEASAQVAEEKAKAARLAAEAAEAKKQAADVQQRKAQNYLKIAVGVIVVVAIMLGVMIKQSIQLSENQNMVLISRLQKVGLEASEIGGSNPRTRQKDLDLWLVLTQLENVGDRVEWWERLWRQGASIEIVKQREKARIQTANRARRVLADLTVMPRSPGTFAEKITEGAALEEVKCLPNEDGTGLLPLTFRKRREAQDGDEEDKEPVTVDYAIAGSSLQYTIGGVPKTAMDLNPKATTVCFSLDATAILVMIEDRGQSSNFVVLTDWNKIGTKWTSLNSQPRLVSSRASQAWLAKSPIDRQRKGEIRFFRKDNILGFLVPTGKATKEAIDNSTGNVGNPASILWTNEGYSETVSLGEQPNWRDPPALDCKTREAVSNSERCSIKRTSQNTGEDVEATYITFKGQRSQCTPEAEYCSIDIKISKENEKLVEFTYQGRPPKNFALYSEFLWIQGIDNVVRRFDRRLDIPKQLLERRWMDLCVLGEDDRGDASTNVRESEVSDLYQEIPKSFGDCKPEATKK